MRMRLPRRLIACVICGKEFEVAGKQRKSTCSKDCSHERRRRGHRLWCRTHREQRRASDLRYKLSKHGQRKTRVRVANTKEHRREVHRRWCAANRERRRESSRRSRLKNIDRIREREREYRARPEIAASRKLANIRWNALHGSAWRRRRYVKNRDKRIAEARRWRQETRAALRYYRELIGSCRWQDRYRIHRAFRELGVDFTEGE